MAGTTYQPINSKAELRAALEVLFEGEQLAWAQDYFEDGNVDQVPSDQQRAFMEGMEVILKGLYRIGDNVGRSDIAADQGVLPLSSEIFSVYVSDGELSRADFDIITTRFDLDELNLRDRMGPGLFSRFEALTIGLVNGLADKGEPIYSRAENDAVLGKAYANHIYDELFSGDDAWKYEFAMERMSGLCAVDTGPVPVSNVLPIREALNYKSAARGG